jgi:hypothetical protein
MVGRRFEMYGQEPRPQLEEVEVVATEPVVLAVAKLTTVARGSAMFSPLLQRPAASEAQWRECEQWLTKYRFDVATKQAIKVRRRAHTLPQSVH